MAGTSAGAFVAVGRDASTGSFDAAVWLSEDDGESWRRADESDDLGGDFDQVMKDVVQIGGRLVAVGWSGRGGAAWTSDDGGRTWELVSADFQGPVGEIELQAVDKLRGRLVAVGRRAEVPGSGNSRAVAWFSDDRGEQWTEATIRNARFSGQQMVDVVPGENGLVAVGSDRPGSAESFEATVWQSQDGRSWIGASSDSFDGPSGIEGIARLSSGTLFAVGSASEDGRIWFSESDG